MKKSLLVIALGLVLTACGGGGGGGSSSPAPVNKPQTTKPVENTQKPTNSANTTPPKTDTTKQPETTKPTMPVENVKGSLSLVQKDLREQVKELKMIDVNGHKLSLAEENVGFIERDFGDGLKGRAYNQAYSAVGYVLPKDVQTDKYGRVIDARASASDTSEFGLMTKFNELPKVGVFTYQGVSFGANSQGKLKLRADFGPSKLVAGSITERKRLTDNYKLDDITLLPAELSRYSVDGNEVHFMGDAMATVDGSPAITPYGGKFMGPKAEEVVGYVADDNGNPYEAFIGTFIGKK